MFEYKYLKFNPTLLEWLWKEGWELTTIYEWIMYFKKSIKKTIIKSIWVANKERLEFRWAYKDIKNSWLSCNALMCKYNKLTVEWKHTSIMKNLDDYSKHLTAHKKKEYALMAQTYINQKRYEDNWEVVKVDFATKWRSDMIKDQNIPEMYIEPIMLEAKKWDATHWTTREMTSWNFQIMIDKYYKK